MRNRHAGAVCRAAAEQKVAAGGRGGWVAAAVVVVIWVAVGALVALLVGQALAAGSLPRPWW